MRTELLILLGAATGATALAELLGAPNLGTALFYGQVAFALAVVAILLRRP